ncbi:MAG: phage terminase large subunit, partial [Algoriella sp.]
EKNSFVFETQYMQNPKPLEGLMYDREFRTYDAIPYSKSAIRKAYIDTADEGKDYLCAIAYEEQPHGNYILDVLYTQKPMEFTEPKTAESLTMHAVEEAVIESNNGGRGFARNVEKQMREMNNNETYVDWFHQSENKNVRIFTKSNEVMNMTFFPVGWEKLWPTFHTHITTYMKVGKNEFDDAPDALTGTVERRGESSIEETEDILSRLNF